MPLEQSRTSATTGTRVSGRHLAQPPAPAGGDHKECNEHEPQAQRDRTEVRQINRVQDQSGREHENGDGHHRTTVGDLAHPKPLGTPRAIEEVVEPSPPVSEAPRPKHSRRKVLAILAAVAIAVAGIAAWQIVRPRSIAEVLSVEHFRARDEVSVQGTITSIVQEDSSYGPRVYLQLDDNAFCGTESWNLLGNPNGSYEIGDSYQTTLHLQAFSIDGDPGVWAPELACPFPALYRSIGVVIDAVSQVRDMLLVYNGTDANGWSRYEIRTQNETGYSPDLLPVVLLKALPFKGPGSLIDSANQWKAVADRFYLMTSAALSPDAPGFSVADRMTSLAAPSSANGTLRFVDADSNGLVDSGDGVDIRLPSTGSPTGWDTYLVKIGNWSAFAPMPGAGVHIILAGPAGPLEVLSAAQPSSFLDLRSVGASKD